MKIFSTVAKIRSRCSFKEHLFLTLSASCLALSLICFTAWTREKEERVAEALAPQVLRFHVLANSDSEADQNVKKQVRDAVGAYIEPYLLECENIEETRATVNDHMDEIIAVSKETLAANGFTYGASAELTHTDFPEKTYGDYTFPEGNYEALEITLGDGAGHNWWCVLYPNMCFRGSVYEVVEDEAKENLKEVLTPDEYESIFDSGKYEIKLKILDIFR